MIIELELFGNLTVMNVEVTGYFTNRSEGDYWQPPEGGYFEIEKIERNGKNITKRLSKCEGLIDQIENHIDENYND
jgi:hypothetical protein